MKASRQSAQKKAMKAHMQSASTRTTSLARASLGSALAMGLLVMALPATADHHGSAHEQQPAASTKEVVDEFVDAEVRKIDKDSGRLTLKHEAIRKFDMAGMTMAFRVAEPSMLDGLAVGDRVRFMPDKRNGQFVIVHIEKLN